MRILIQILIGLLFCATSLASPITHICNYETYSDKKGSHKVKEEFVLTFIEDKSNKKSYIVGNNGTVEVVAVSNMFGGTAFIEITDSGSVMTTSVDSKGNSTHSRHASIFGALVSTQYYGACRKKK